MNQASLSDSMFSILIGNMPTGLIYPTLRPSFLNLKPSPIETRLLPEYPDVEPTYRETILVPSYNKSCVNSYHSFTSFLDQEWIYFGFDDLGEVQGYLREKQYGFFDSLNICFCFSSPSP